MSEAAIENLRNEYNPADKSYVTKMAIAETRYGDPDYAIAVVEDIPYPGDDISALLSVLKALPDRTAPLRVGEARTLYAICQYDDWKIGGDREFIVEGTLVARREKMPTKEQILACRNQSELLRLPGLTSQWASAAVLAGDPERLTEDVPSKLQLTYDVWEEWHALREFGIPWVARPDAVIGRQITAFLRMFLDGKDLDYEVREAEEAVFGMILGDMTVAEAEARYPSLRDHESDRIEETPRMLDLALAGEPVPTWDHRIIHPLGMLGLLLDMDIDFVHPKAVNKTWVRYYEFLEAVRLVATSKSV